MITRFAPTPSGFLHEGNAVNALLVAWLAQGAGGSLILRIDDMDATRSRAEYIDDIFSVLAWLGIDWQLGPRDPDDFGRRFGSARRTDRYRQALDRAREDGLDVYACTCSRRALSGRVPTGGCPGGCRSARLDYERDRTALRLHVPIGTEVEVAGTTVDLASAMGDFVVWRRDDLPAYHLASVIEDHHHGVTDVVRGLDLLDSTAAQLFLAQGMGLADFTRTRFVHHPLLTDASGRKLSKSQVTRGRPLPRTDEGRSRLVEAAERIGSEVRITRHALRS
ncbi:MAG: hypothetical protein GC156_15980 [Actinomycetales bacterium]|nr:hypothetical protein [Actinomycetales bacterium]